MIISFSIRSAVCFLYQNLNLTRGQNMALICCWIDSPPVSASMFVLYSFVLGLLCLIMVWETLISEQSCKYVVMSVNL